MEGNIFINEAMGSSIQKYLTYKSNPNREEFNTFLVVVIRALCLIYGELDIVNPYRTNNEKGFLENLKKFGFPEKELLEWKQEILSFYQNSENDEICSELFINIQKKLVDMFSLRKSHVLVTDEELNQFKSLLYTKNDLNQTKLALYTKYTPNSDTILYYLNSKLFEIKHNFKLTEYKEITLRPDAYQLAGFNAVEVMNMKEEDILNINNKVYHFFRIKDNDTNKRVRLEDAINYYKKYGNTITTGNGYVDLLLLFSVIATGLMLIILVGVQLMR